MNGRSSSLLILLLISGLAVANAAMFLNPVEVGPIEQTDLSPRVAKTPDQQSTVAPSRSTMGAATSRPLFSPNRRPFVALALQPSQVIVDAAVIVQDVLPPSQPEMPIEMIAVNAPPPAAALMGIQKSSLSSKALIMPASTQDAAWFAKGALIDGWRVEAIGETFVTLMLGDQTHRIELYPPLRPAAIDP
jgi:hypothetical protein